MPVRSSFSTRASCPVRRQRRELQVTIAVDARNRRPARRILLDEVRDDVIAELLFEIHDVVRDAKPRRDAPRIVQIVDRAAAPEADVASALIVELHRQTDDVMPGLRHQRCSHGRIDTAGHRYDYSHRTDADGIRRSALGTRDRTFILLGPARVGPVNSLLVRRL